jgi:hypothetical protein
MLGLLLDEHISPDVLDGLKRRSPSLLVRWMLEWEDGNFLGKDDFACLSHAFDQGLTLVTYDRRTIPPILKRWAEEGRQHGGVIFVDEKTIPPSNFGGLARAIARLAKESARWGWTGRIYFLGKR